MYIFQTFIVIPLCTKFGGYIEIILSACADSCLVHNFFWFDIGLLYLAQGCMAMSQCVTHNHNPYTTSTFNLKVKFTGYLTCFHVRSIIFGGFDNSWPFLAHGCITMFVFVCLFGVHRPTREFFTYIETSPLAVKGCKFWPILDTHGHWAVRVL